MTKNSEYYTSRWTKPNYVGTKIGMFQRLDQYLPHPPQRILDIGCGFAKTSELFQKKYGTELYLLEGERNDRPGDRTGKYGEVDNFRFYLPVDKLRQQWDEQGMTYTFVNGASPDIDPNVKFDLVYSWLSCGFHYPVGTYRDLIKQHTTDDSIIIMDFRCIHNNFSANFADEGIQVVKELVANNKFRTLHIKLL